MFWWKSRPFCKYFPAKKCPPALSLCTTLSVALVIHFTLRVSDFILFPYAGRHEAPSPLPFNWSWLLHCAILQSWTTSRKDPHHSTHTVARATQQRQVQCQLHAFELNQLLFQRQGEGSEIHIDNMKREYYVYYTDRTKDTTTTWQILLNCTETVKKTRRCLLEQKDEVRDVQCIGEGWQRNKRKNRPYMKKGAEIKVLNGCQVASSSALNFLHGSRAHMWQRLIEVHGRNIKHRTHHLNTPPLQWHSVCYLWPVLEWPRKRNSCFRHVLAYMQIKLDESRSSGLS